VIMRCSGMRERYYDVPIDAIKAEMESICKPIKGMGVSKYQGLVIQGNTGVTFLPTTLKAVNE